MLLDPGDNSEEARIVLAAAFDDLGLRLSNVELIIASHLHRDHMGMAAHVQEISGAPFAIHRAEHEAIVAGTASVTMTRAKLTMWGIPSERWAELQGLPRLPREIRHPRWDLLLNDGETISTGERDLGIIHVPGHTAGHIAIFEEKSQVLMTGDLILPSQNPGIGLGGRLTNPLSHYRRSLQIVSSIEHRVAIPGHGNPLHDLRKRSREILEHHENRSREIAAIIENSPLAQVWEIARKLTWGKRWESFRGPELRLALHHVDTHMQYLAATD